MSWCITCRNNGFIIRDWKTTYKMLETFDGPILSENKVGGIDICPVCQSRSETEYLEFKHANRQTA